MRFVEQAGERNRAHKGVYVIAGEIIAEKSACRHDKLFEKGGRETENTSVQGALCDTPEYLESYENRGIKKLRK